MISNMYYLYIKMLKWGGKVIESSKWYNEYAISIEYDSILYDTRIISNVRLRPKI